MHALARARTGDGRLRREHEAVTSVSVRRCAASHALPGVNGGVCVHAAREEHAQTCGGLCGGVRPVIHCAARGAMRRCAASSRALKGWPAMRDGDGGRRHDPRLCYASPPKTVMPPETVMPPQTVSRYKPARSVCAHAARGRVANKGRRVVGGGEAAVYVSSYMYI
jgi:hypothetical protein